MTTAVHSAIAKRFPSPEFATFFEVRDDAGFNAKRSADVIAMNTWPSRGLAVNGIEVKVSRSDWLRELADPSKSAPIQRYCDHWWLAVSDDSIAKVEEVPETWGLLVLRGKALVQVKAAPKLVAESLTRGFVAVLLRNATKGLVPAARVNELVTERLEREVKRIRDDATWRAERDSKDLADLRGRVASFEKASGIGVAPDSFAFSEPTKLGAAVRALLSGGLQYSPAKMRGALNVVESVAKDLRVAVDAVSALLPQSDSGVLTVIEERK